MAPPFRLFNEGPSRGLVAQAAPPRTHVVRQD
jgi:hypothetical protein